MQANHSPNTVVNPDREQQEFATALGKFTKTQLLRLAEGIGEQVPISASRTEIVVVLLRAAGYKLKKPPQAPTRAQELTYEQLEYLLYTYLCDELLLLKAVANGMNDLILLRDLNTEKSADGQAINVPPSVLRQRLEHALEELRYYHGHSNIRAIANIYRIVNPNAKLDL